MTQQTQSDQLCIDTLRTLPIDAVQQSNSGYPGTPMGAAPTAYCLWQRFLRYDPCDPEWLNRRRFVLSADHASALLYSPLYLTGVKATSPRYDQAAGCPSRLTTSSASGRWETAARGTRMRLDLRYQNRYRLARAGREGTLKSRLTLLRRLPAQ
ncbi:hypothetical protein [Nitrosospira sp. NRS527]|uniref:hypothetical protein n=1 Tax=Nitrosospira sp. NRS527 TaxID=155925 RepID=UPI001AF2BEA4|nr:hypothetical protein [Nitrosospira sp. NRS527]BCT66876.1 hypothetical protein NNRS527_00445 [Nitrosospira sp. NRS527]